MPLRGELMVLRGKATETRFTVKVLNAPHLYSTLVGPHLEYAIQTCSPNLVADADSLEQIQWLATRLVKVFRRLPYDERLRRLGLHCLRRFRLRGDLIVVQFFF